MSPLIIRSFLSLTWGPLQGEYAKIITCCEEGLYRRKWQYPAGWVSCEAMMTVTRSLVESFPIVCRAHYVQMLSSAFAKTAMLLKGKSESYQQPWRKTADRLRETDNAAFSEYRDTFYKFLFASTTAALLAHEASASDSSIAQSFLAEYREVREFHAWLDSSASETGLSGKLKDEATELYAAWQKLETHQ